MLASQRETLQLLPALKTVQKTTRKASTDIEAAESVVPGAVAEAAVVGAGAAPCFSTYIRGDSTASVNVPVVEQPIVLIDPGHAVLPSLRMEHSKQGGRVSGRAVPFIAVFASEQRWKQGSCRHQHYTTHKHQQRRQQRQRLW